LGWYWFSEKPEFNPELGKEYIQIIHAATSTYLPGAELQVLASKKYNKPVYTHIRMPDYLLTRQGFCDNKFYAGPAFTLGSMASGYGGWTGSTSQIVSWKMVGKPTSEKELPFQISGNGMYFSNIQGKIKDPFTQVLQSENVLFQLTRLPTNLAEIEKVIGSKVKEWSKNWKKDFFNRFPTETYKTSVIKETKEKRRKSNSFLVLDQRGEASLENGVYFVHLGETYVAIRSIHQEYPLAMKGKSVKAPYEFDWVSDNAAPGSLCGFVLEFGDFSTHGTYEHFKASIKKTVLKKPTKDLPLQLEYTDTHGRVLHATFVSNGTFEEAIVDWGYGVSDPQTHITSPPFIQPAWPSGEGYGTKGLLLVNGQPEPTFDGIFKSPLLELQNGILRHHLNGKTIESHP